MRRSWRRWLPGRKHGIARGIAVASSPGAPDPAALVNVLGPSDRLRLWARERGVDLTGDPADLRGLDEAIAQQAAPPEVMAWLPLDAGLYLGSLLVEHVNEASWALWPNGHPVVRLPRHADVDVTAVTTGGMSQGGFALWAVYEGLAG